MNKNKLYLTVMATILGSTTSIASTNNGNYFKSDAYIGAAAGYSYMNAGISDQTSIPGYSQFSGSARGSDISHNLVGDILLGYRHFLNNDMAMGIELDLGRDHNRVTKKLVGSQFGGLVQLRSVFKFLPSVTVGYKLSERWLGIAKLGMSLRRFKGTHTNFNTINSRVLASETFSQNKKGFMAAVGAEYAFNKNISGTWDVTYERFQKINLNYKNINFPNEQNKGSVKPSYVTVKVGVLYRF